MIVSIVGPPGVGKSRFISKFVLERPYWTYVDIEYCRKWTHKPDGTLGENEKAAWKFLRTEILSNRDIILETAGLHWLLPQILHEVSEDHYILNIYMHDNRREMLKERVRVRRITKPLPLPFRLSDEIAMVDKVIDEIWDWKDLLPGEWQIIHMEEDETEAIENMTQYIMSHRLLQGPIMA